MRHTVCIAPMMGWTDRHQRYFVRQICRQAPVFTEMLAPEAILRGDRDYYMKFHPVEHPVVFQLGGHEPEVLARASREVEREGYDEVNLNVGCPSEKGITRKFGAHLMKEPHLVADCLTAMREAVSIPVSIKTRIGVDDQDSYEELTRFVDIVRQSGCRVFTFHARKAWLQGLSPRANRHVPPLRYEMVYRIKRDFPDLHVIINGGITEWSDASGHLEHVDGVMVGRRAYKDPLWLLNVDRDYYGSTEPLPRPTEVMRRCVPYVEAELAAGTPLRAILRHQYGIYQASRGSKAWRRSVAAIEGNRRAGLEGYLELIDLLEQFQVNDRWVR